MTYSFLAGSGEHLLLSSSCPIFLSSWSSRRWVVLHIISDSAFVGVPGGAGSVPISALGPMRARHLESVASASVAELIATALVGGVSTWHEHKRHALWLRAS